MKLLSRILILFFISFTSEVYSIVIEDIKTNDDVVLFVKNHIREAYDFKLAKKTDYSSGHLYDSLKIQPWELLDLNKDNKLDLIVNGVLEEQYEYFQVIIINKGKGLYVYERISLIESTYPKIISYIIPTEINKWTIIIYKDLKSINCSNYGNTWKDTLIYKYNNFLEYNANTNNKKAKLIRITYTQKSLENGEIHKYQINGNGIIRHEITVKDSSYLVSEGKVSKKELEKILGVLLYLKKGEEPCLNATILKNNNFTIEYKLGKQEHKFVFFEENVDNYRYYGIRVMMNSIESILH